MSWSTSAFALKGEEEQEEEAEEEEKTESEHAWGGAGGRCGSW